MIPPVFMSSGWPYVGINLKKAKTITTTESNPIIPTGTAANDFRIQEIGNMIYEQDDVAAPYKMTYTGVTSGGSKSVWGAYSTDGYNWTKYGKLFDGGEDPYVIKENGIYYCYVENYVTPADLNILLFTATDFDGTWTNQGVVLDKNVGGVNVAGTASPIVFKEGGKYYMFYEGAETAFNTDGYIWIAESTDLINWTNRQLILNANDLSITEDSLICDDIIKVGGKYYMTFHDGRLTGDTTRCAILVSGNLINWTLNDADGFVETDLTDVLNDLDADTIMIGKISNKIVLYYYDNNLDEGGVVNSGIYIADQYG